jgi:hypothetical protein
VGEKEPLHISWECKLVQSLWKLAQNFLRKLKIELSYDPAMPTTPGYVSTGNITPHTIGIPTH